MAGALVLLLALAIGAGDERKPTTVATKDAPKETPGAPSSGAAELTSTAVALLPVGEDAQVREVTDGDSLVTEDGTRIRLIGIDAPDTESEDCFSSEATTGLEELVRPGTAVRLVYDVERLDRFERTLAYVYRLPDGLFVNSALARGGFAREMTTPPNVAHAEELRSAVEEARAARRGLWGACAMTTTMAAPTAGTTTGPTTALRTPQTTEARSEDCHPSYLGACVPVGVSDVDCAGGGGNGPVFVSEKDIRVVGPDVYELDGRDNDGLACES